jgi:hypothetical protein
MGALAAAPAGGQHSTDLASRERMRATVGPAAAVGQASLTMLAVAAKPLVGGGPRHPQALGGLGGRPAQLGDPLHQQQPTELGQASITMGHEGPLPARRFDNPSRSRGPSTVNNPRGNYS